METLAQLAAWSLLTFSILLFLSQALAREAGFWLGSRHREIHGTGESEGVGLVVGGMLGLLAFVLALTLSFSSSRFDERRLGILTEANAIGTAWLRAKAIGHPRGQDIARLLNDYAKLRKEYVQAPRDRPVLDSINERTSKLQTEIWVHASEIVRERTDPVAVSVLASINEVFDMSTAERFAHDSRVPPPLFWLLMAMAHMSMAVLGFQLAIKSQKSRVLPSLLTAVWTAVIVVILDLSAPRIGAIRTSVDVYDWTLESLKSDVAIPPPLQRE